MKLSDHLRNFIYEQVDHGYVFIADMAYVCLGENRHDFYVWALRGDDPELLVDQFKRDIKTWVTAAGKGCIIVVRRWPEMEPRFEGGVQLTARMLIVNRHPYYNSVQPPFMPKPEGEEPQVLGGSDDA